ncbi:putative methyltransferase DDB_G0268948 isoform X1 [Biomphalaria glabrata]|uniref:Methyltransferase DDB_G0268948 isoform X1 n=1 Tax=Biomphalaria glabrata TaxID=6526 RepID=A0A9W3B8R7_BIOGL|nr:putative methyltransferase DDB_G0268948 isoform X1 [Biomphalaria glabrata]XP_055895824.1 putative methyltransferase DDB_G0268948 isoform X1 [Biomphalaria glabrata]XP_055895825.1 putative methyltransferase DDB_G0268948 isoform X1 [Biomphalaria glabrata]XP_055895826.1 putative methyltransferase DDB_G0268948 isoform X1 [Biomphalaria glabrata]
MGAAPSTQEYVASWKSLLAGNVEETEEYLQRLYQGKELAQAYAAYRPKYPQAVFDAIMTYHDEVTNNGRSMALDVCCGPGQSTLPLVPLFEKVVGVDISQDLLDHMPKDIPNLTTYRSAAEDLFMIASDSVDLITSGASLHWLNTEKFFKEAKRVLKPGGTFATYMFQIEDLCNEEANKAYKEFLSTMKDYLTSKTLIVAHKYETIDFPFDCLKRLDIQTKMEMTIGQFKGYMASCHFWPLYSQANPTTHILEDFMISLQHIFGNGTTSSAEVNMKVYRKNF